MRSVLTCKARWQRPPLVGFQTRRSGAGSATRICAPAPDRTAEAAVIPRTTPWRAVTSPRQHHHTDGGEGTCGSRTCGQRLHPPRHPTLNPCQVARRGFPVGTFREGQVQPGGDRRITRVDCREDARTNESRRAVGQAGIGAGGDVCVQRRQRTIPRGV